MDTIESISESLKGKPGIDGKDEYFLSSVLIPVIKISDELHLIFQIRNQNIRQGGEISFPGGAFDALQDGESVNTALRETCEELGIDRDDIEILGQIDTIVAPMGAVIDNFVGVIKKSLEEFNINKHEVERIFTVPLAYFIETEPEKHNVMIRTFSSEKNEETGEKIVYMPVKELGLPDRYDHSWGEFKPKVYFFNHPEGLIWGLTARIIMNFLRKLGH